MERQDPSQAQSSARARCSSCGAIAEVTCAACGSSLCRGCAYGDRLEGYLCLYCDEEESAEDR